MKVSIGLCFLGRIPLLGGNDKIRRWVLVVVFKLVMKMVIINKVPLLQATPIRGFDNNM